MSYSDTHLSSTHGHGPLLPSLPPSLPPHLQHDVVARVELFQLPDTDHELVDASLGRERGRKGGREGGREGGRVVNGEFC